MDITSDNGKMVGELGKIIFGTAPPTRDELRIAQEILDATPVGSPLEIARYIMEDKHENQDKEAFNKEWKVRSNPLIVAFFLEATNYSSPDLSDQTKWCAAFVNWCLKRAHMKYTNSASSGSFRCYQTEPAPPVAGDVAVFKNNGQNQACAGSGHVGFWISETATHVRTLGGNQGDTVKYSNYPKTQTDGAPWLMTIRRPVAA